MNVKLVKDEVIGREVNEYISKEVTKGMVITCETKKIRGEDIFVSKTQYEINKNLSHKIANILNRGTQDVKQTV